MKYKALMIDVDGTLLIPGQKLPSPAVTNAIKKANEKIHIGIASSRPLHLTEFLFDHLELSGPAVLCGGALIIDMKTKIPLKEYTIGPKTTLQICNLLKKLDAPFFVHDNGQDTEFTKDYVPKKPQNIVGWKIHQNKVESILKELKKIPTINAYKINSQDDDSFYIDITDIHATKQHGILEVAKILKLETHDFIGIGDGYNDFPLLMACGLKVAMGNAIEDLKEIADYIAPPVDEDGVADVINRFVL